MCVCVLFCKIQEPRGKHKIHVVGLQPPQHQHGPPLLDQKQANIKNPAG